MDRNSCCKEQFLIAAQRILSKIAEAFAEVFGEPLQMLLRIISNYSTLVIFFLIERQTKIKLAL